MTTSYEYRLSANGGVPVCEFCEHASMKEIESDLYWCERCGSSKMLFATGSWMSRPGQSDPKQWDASQEEPMSTEHEQRWAAATNDPNGNY